jgi:Fic/DOC family
MKLSKSSSYSLVHILNGHTTAQTISEQVGAPDIRSIQRALQRLNELGFIDKHGASNNPRYSANFPNVLQANIDEKAFDDESRPDSQFRFALIDWLHGLTTDELDTLFDGSVLDGSQIGSTISPKELEYLTVELSWKSSALEGNTYTLLDTQLLLTEGVTAKNRTQFETQMILNHKDAVAFIIENRDLFTNKLVFSTIEELHRIIGDNLGIESGVRKKLVRISASNYIPLAGPQQLREQMDRILEIISRPKNPYTRALLALALVPYLQLFEDGNKRTGRMLANALLISSVGHGFSLRKVEARQLALAYLAFYEYSSIFALNKILEAELKQLN